MKDRTYRIISLVSLILIVIAFLMIFLFSSEDASKSSKTSGKITDFVISTFYKDYDEMTSSEKSALRSKIDHRVRKTAHFTEFFILSFLLMVHVFTLLEYKKKKNYFSFLVVVPIGVIYAIIDECHQLFVGGRGPAINDVLIDSLGVIVGSMIAYMLLMIIKHSIIKKNRKLEKEE